jgi:hypothetical protein
MKPNNPKRTALAALAFAGLALGCEAEPAPPEDVASSPYYLTCDDLLIWRADYEEIGEGISYDATIPDAILDPDPTPFLGQLRCPPPPGYAWDDQLVIVNLYWSPEMSPDAAMPDAFVVADAAQDAADASWDAADASWDAADAAWDASIDAALVDAAPDAAPDADIDAAPDADAGPYDAAIAHDADTPHDGGGGPWPDAIVAVGDAACVDSHGNAVACTEVPIFAGPACPPKPVQPRPVIPTKPATPQTQIPLPPGATKPPPIKVEPPAVKTAATSQAVKFTDPVAKLQATAQPEFRAQLWTDITLLDPAIGARGTQVHMGYWSGPGNHKALNTLLTEINTNGGPRVRAFFDEGISPTQLMPAYRTMTAEAWYPRGKLVDGKGSLEGGVKITDPFPTTFAQADRIWGQYSQRYAQLALDVQAATGKPVEVWCYVEGAKVDRVFYKYELPILKDLETLGVVKVHFAKTKEAKHTNPNDWWHGTANAPEPGPPANPPPLGPP